MISGSVLSLNVYDSSYEHDISILASPLSSRRFGSNIRNSLSKVSPSLLQANTLMLTPKSAWLLHFRAYNAVHITFRAAYFEPQLNSQVPNITSNSLVFKIKSINNKNEASKIKYFLSGNNKICQRQQSFQY